MQNGLRRTARKALRLKYTTGDDPGPLGKPEAQKLDKSDPDCHWDPTDPDEENPWQQTETSVTESEQEKTDKNRKNIE